MLRSIQWKKLSVLSKLLLLSLKKFIPNSHIRSLFDMLKNTLRNTLYHTSCEARTQDSLTGSSQAVRVSQAAVKMLARLCSQLEAHQEKQVCFRDHLGCWQNLFPFCHRTENLGFLLSPGSWPQLPQAGHSPLQ